MNSINSYENYIQYTKKLNIPAGRQTYQAPYAKDFEKIYEKAKAQDVSLTNAREFLSKLSSKELLTLQYYSGLADPIKIEKISSEGAFNLFVYDNEQYDFNDDGVAEVGEAKHMLVIPKNMPNDVKEAYIATLNLLDDSQRLQVMALSLTRINFNNSLGNTQPVSQPIIDYNYIQERIENILNPTNGSYASDEAKETIRQFRDIFNEQYSKRVPSEESKNDSAVEQFLYDLRKKGAIKFLADLNQEKIDKLVEEYETQLLKDSNNSPEALKNIEKVVEDFRTSLIKAMQKKFEDKLANQKEHSFAISSNKLIQSIIELQKDNQDKPFEELLKLL